MSIDAPSPPRPFRPRTSVFLAIISWLIGLAIIVFSLPAGAAGLAGIPLGLAIACLGYWLFWFPAVRVDDDAVTLVNPVVTVRIPWVALINVDTKFALTLFTPSGKYAAWAAPAQGALGTFRASTHDATDLPRSSYGRNGGLRPGDLKNSDSGAAAALVRTHWAALVEAGAIDVDQLSTVKETQRVNWLVLSVTLVLVIAAMAVLSV